MLPKKLLEKLAKRKLEGNYREVKTHNFIHDFFSNDYLGFSNNPQLQKSILEALESNKYRLGSTGSRLISGNHPETENLEVFLANYHQSEAALLYNSGYDANLGFFGSIPQKNDLVLCDELIHASIKDGIKLSNAKSYKYKHLDLHDLDHKINKFKASFDAIYVVTESLFSMDGDSPNIIKMIDICQKHNVNLVVDEAHALGLYPLGLVQQLNAQDKVLARIFTFGKALGTHGATIIGTKLLKDYLINFSRSFIYTTAPNAHQVLSIQQGYNYLIQADKEIKQLKSNINYFLNSIKNYPSLTFIPSISAIQSLLIKDVEKAKKLANKCQEAGFGIKPILSPTVPFGQERLRICLHSYNTKKQIKDLLNLLAQNL